MMVWEGMPYDQAARTVNLHVRSMRRALGYPHVIAYLNRERQVLRTSVTPRNIHRLVEIRDAENNMPAVNAIKVLEQLGEEHGPGGSGSTPSAGVTIRVVTVVQGQASVTRHEPLIEQKPNVINDASRTYHGDMSQTDDETR